MTVKKSPKSWIEFRQVIAQPRRKTHVWDVLSFGKWIRARLGQVSWDAHVRRYTFKPNDGMPLSLDAKYLTEIAEFCAEETEKHRVKVRGEKS